MNNKQTNNVLLIFVTYSAIYGRQHIIILFTDMPLDCMKINRNYHYAGYK